MTYLERTLFEEIIKRLEQGGQAGAVSILLHWVKNEKDKTTKN